MEEWDKLETYIKGLLTLIDATNTTAPAVHMTTEQLTCKVACDTEIMLYCNCKLLESINKKLNILFEEVSKKNHTP